MDVEIRTLDGAVWVTTVDDRDLSADDPGASALSVGNAIKAGTAIEVREPANGHQQARWRSPSRLMVFNPGTVISVAQQVNPRRY